LIRRASRWNAQDFGSAENAIDINHLARISSKSDAALHRAGR
jgi:hypothetical protein